MSCKISDLQGIRGIAIIAVLGFHFYPKIVPNGYLGVDQFFVLSGFLMCMLLTKSENMPVFSLVSIFYTRRFKRILPLYQLVIFSSLVFLYFCFPDTSIIQNEQSAEKALIFMSNRLKTDQESYFEMLSIAIDIFTHTWSLSVEIQFYLIVPFIFLLPYKLVSFSIISIISIVYHYSIPSNIAFLNMSTRIWQFMIGMIAFILRPKMSNTHLPLNTHDCEKQEVTITAPKYCSETFMLTSAMLITVFFPITFSEEFTRPIVTGLTGLLLICTSGESLFLSNKILTYIGDISYSLYLIHWPLYSYWKLTRNGDMVQLFAFLVISITLSILIYENFEKWYTKLSNIPAIILIVLISLCNLAVLKHHDYTYPHSKLPHSDGVLDNMTMDDAIRLNKEWNIHDYDYMQHKSCKCEAQPVYGWCNHTGLNPSNKYKIMIIGNSWAANHGGIIYDECGGKANLMIQGAGWGCEPFYSTSNLPLCHGNMTETERRVMEFKPDYVFHLTKHMSYGEGSLSDFDNDPTYQTMLRQMRKLTSYTKKKFYILDAIPWVHSKVVENIGAHLKNNISLVELDQKIAVKSQVDVARKRYAQLFKDCGSKCERIDYHDLFYRNDTNTYRYYDERGFMYFTSGNHLSPHGLERVRHIYRDICDKI